MITVRRPNLTELGNVAQAMTLLHKMENGSPLAPGATPQRAYAFLAALTDSRGVVAAAFDERGFAGCIVMQFDKMYPASMLVGGLYVEPSARPKTVLLLMDEVIAEAHRRGVGELWMMAGTDKNKTRRSYARLGFRHIGGEEGYGMVFRTTLAEAEAGLGQMKKCAKARKAEC